MKTLLKVFAVVFGLFILIPLVYGVGEMFVDVWRDILPYSWTHSVNEYHYHPRHH